MKPDRPGLPWKVLTCLLACCACPGLACDDGGRTARREVVVYCSADQEFAEPILAEFEKATGIKVRARYDAEADKTVGLVNRIREELKAGLASTRDVLEAEDDLRSSRNALTAALVNYVTTRLRFLATLGMIAVDEQGRFHERNRPDHLDRYRGDAPTAP